MIGGYIVLQKLMLGVLFMPDIQFIIELTNGCNFACKYCYLAQAQALKKQISKNVSRYRKKYYKCDNTSYL